MLFFFYIILPVYSTFRFNLFPFQPLLIFYLINIFLVFYFLSKSYKRIPYFKLQVQNLQEKINILNDRNVSAQKNGVALQKKINRYHSLKRIIEEINRNLDLESIAEHLVSNVFSLIADAKGTCILYLRGQERQSLSLFKTKKEDKKLTIKTKEGDVFDFWVLKHSSPLLIEDIKKDFRFDLEKLKTEGLRPISSLVSSPLISEQEFLGILRLDHPQSNFYSQDDLRFLVAICDLGAVALENGELFQKTQELAIRDELTGLYTKGYFLERLEEEYKRCVRRSRNLSLLMLDIDYFKNYNDRFGHTAGDIVLKMLGQNIVEATRDLNPITSRFGGEEFCVILPDIDKKKAIDAAEAIRRKIENTKIILRRTETFVTVSIGVATFADDAKDEDELILKADRAMYQAKQSGRNRVVGA